MNSVTIKYYVQNIDKNLAGDLFSTASKEDAIKKYTSYCEDLPENNFQIVKVETFREVIAKSNDVRQALLSLG